LLRRHLDLLLHSIRGRLILLTVAVVFPAVLAAGLLIHEAHHNERAAVERQLSETARALSLVVDRQLGQSRSLLLGLATSPDLARGDIAAFRRQAETAVADIERWIVLIDRNGRQLMNTRGRLTPPYPAFEPHDAMARALAHDKAFVSNLHSSAVSAGSILSVAIPVTVAGQDHALVLVMPSSALSDVLIDQQLPENWVAAILDGEFTVVARSRLPEHFVGREATPDVRTALQRQDQGVLESTGLEDTPMLIAFSRVPGSGWTVVVGAPRDELLEPILRLVAIAFLATFGLLLVGVAMSMWIGRRVVHAMDMLSAAAATLGRGETPADTVTGMHETDSVAEAMQRSALRLKAREDELKRLNETLEVRVAEAAESLVQARKLEALGRLTGGVAHDFNNLLMAVRVNLELLARRVDDEKLRRIIDNAHHATERGVTLTAQLLAFARKQRLKPEPVDVNAAVTAMSDLLRGTLGGGVRVEPALAPDLPPAYADRTQLELIVMNLAINARDAMQPGGVVRVETAEQEVAARPSRPEWPDPGRYVVMTVADTGSGMAPEVLERVFEPFFTTKGAGRGTGLGLPQVLGVVKQLGGGVRIESHPGKGTRVSIFLPLAPAHTAAGESTSRAEAAAPDLAGLTVLLVDDDAQVRRALTGLLRELGCEVIAADGGEAALRLLEDGAEPQVALLDYAMPGMNGVELAQHLRRRRPRLPLLLMSGHVASAELPDGWFETVLKKPFSKKELAGALAAAAHAAPPRPMPDRS